MDRRQVEQAADFGKLFDAIPSASLVLDPDLVIVWANPAYEEATARRRHQLVGRPVFDAFPDNPGDPEATGVRNLSASMRRVLATRRPETLPVQRYDIPVGDGEGFVERYWIPRNIPVLHDDGTVAWLLHVADDVTETVHARNEVEAGEVRFRELVEHASDAILIVDRDRRFTYVSPAVRGLLGYEPEAVYSSTWGDFTDTIDRAAALDLHQRAARAEPGRTMSLQLRIRRRDGEQRWVEVQATNRLTTTAVDGLVMNIRDVTQQRAAEEQLETRALQDPLTGLSNRRALFTALQRASARAGRTGRSLALILIDIDHFKVVNDHLGHAAGDRLLVELAERMTAVLRPSDILARLGGDEFVVLADELTGEADAITVAERLAAAGVGPYRLDPAVESQVTLSIGVATATAGATDPEALMAHADSALYEAKRGGRGRVELFDPRLREQLLRRQDLARQFAAALDAGEMTLHWQPIATTGGSRLVGAEALVRWDHPDRGLIPPADFLPMAEQAGLMPDLCAWIIEHAVRQAAVWQTLPEPPHVVINLAAVQLVNTHLVEQLLRWTTDHGVDPAMIGLDVSERMLGVDVSMVREHLTALRRRGFGVALDDFGASATSLSWLQDLPIDVLKLDRRFAASLEDPATRAVAQAIVQLATALGIATVAEGVETGAQLATFARLGCDYAQGYHIAAPMPADDLTARFTASAR